MQAGPSKPLGLVVTSTGAIDKDHYLKTLNVHPDMLAVIEQAMAGMFPCIHEGLMLHH